MFVGVPCASEQEIGIVESFDALRGEHDVRAVDHHVRDDLAIDQDEAVVGEKREQLVVEHTRVVHELGPLGVFHELKVMTLVVRVRPVVVNIALVRFKIRYFRSEKK